MKFLHLLKQFQGDIFPLTDRKSDTDLIRTTLKRSRIVVLPGPRQCGKTTLARLAG